MSVTAEAARYDPSCEKEHSKKIRRFFECSKYKNKISTDNGEAYAELFQIVILYPIELSI